jgi:hypothetical protein
MNNEALRRRLGYSADRRRHEEERASKWLIALGCVWLVFIALLMWSVPALILSLISGFPFGAVLAGLLVLSCVVGTRSK